MTKNRLTFRAAALYLSLAGWFAVFGAVEDTASPTQEAILERIDQLRSTGQLSVGNASIAAIRVLPAFYEQREYRPAWTETDNVGDLLGVLEHIDDEGLDPQDYFLAELKGLIDEASRNPGEAALQANLDILLTESLLRLGYHLRFGKVNPEQLDSNWNLSRDLDGDDPVEAIQRAIDSESLERFLLDAFPRGVIYLRMKSALEDHRRIAESGGWPRVPEGPVLKPGMRDERVVILRNRLARSGDLGSAAAGDSRLFDDSLEQAVIRFQGRHGLQPDGVVGGQTLQALNVPVERRIDQIRVNLERARWVMRDLPEEFLIADIAGFRVLLVRGREIAWSARAQVGKPYRKTPVFKGELSYLEFNPTWTVPPTILAKDVLPAIQRDPDYLRKKNMTVLDRGGRVVDPSTIDWSSYSTGGFPYMIRQEPGPSNALGRVKFIFPNKHFVFLHDTPSKSLFGRAERTFSSGCIRVEHPFELAALVLEGEDGWERGRIQEVLDSKKTLRVFPSDELTVLLLYWTVAVDEEGIIAFRKDVYDRDGRVLEALDGDFVISVPGGMPDYLGGP